jgi:chemotaxis signal transduction protein
VALVADEVTGVLEVPAHQMEPPADPLSQSRPLVAVVRRDEGLVLVLDATRLLPPAEAI